MATTATKKTTHFVFSAIPAWGKFFYALSMDSVL